MTPLSPLLAVDLVGSQGQRLVATRLRLAARWRMALAAWLIRQAGRLMRVEVEFRDP